MARSPDLATSVGVIDLTVGGIGVTLTPTASSRAERSPDMQESARFLDLADQVLERFRPHVLLTYGGHPACLELMRGARMKSVAVVFLLHHSVPMSAACLTTSRSRRPAKTGNRARLCEAARPREAADPAKPPVTQPC